MTTTLPIGTTGAKRQSQKKASPRSLLRGIIDGSPRDSESAIRNKFTDAIRDDEDMIDTIIEYWFANNYHRIVTPDERSQAREEKAKLRIKERSSYMEATTPAAIDIIKLRAERMVFLNMVMPNGKLLAECTFKECSSFGSKFMALSAVGKPNERVGKLSELEVRKYLK